MQLLHTIADCRDFHRSVQGQALQASKPYRLALVPTMGALHQGHMALVTMAQQTAQHTVVSIFVNPTQFAPTEDLSRYPRPLEADLAQCEAAGVSAVFLPDVAQMYPYGDKTEGLTLVQPPAELTSIACGQSRPGHYTGVATVVLKLLTIIQPDVAVFGEKDAQQLAILRRMVEDLNLPVILQEHPVIRETDGPLAGVAMSSRNRYLTGDAEQEAATILFNILRYARAHAQVGLQVQPVLSAALQTCVAGLSPQAQAVFKPDYLLAVDANRFTLQTHFTAVTRLLMAAWIGKTRLIDTLYL